MNEMMSAGGRQFQWEEAAKIRERGITAQW